MKHEIVIKDLGSIDQAAGEFLKETAGHNIIAFYAPMGAGKTTFTTALCNRLGVKEDAVSSPTFSIVNEYKASDGSSVFHIKSNLNFSNNLYFHQQILRQCLYSHTGTCRFSCEIFAVYFVKCSKISHICQEAGGL